MINSTAYSQAQAGADAYTDLTSVQAIGRIKDKDQALEKIAEQFESMMVRMMMKSMRAANEVFAEGNLLSSKEGDMYQDMLDDQLSLTLSQGRGLGVAEVMVRQLKGRFGQAAAVEKSQLGNISDYLERRNNYQGPAPIVRGASSPLDIVKTHKKIPGQDVIAADRSAAIDNSMTFDGSIQQFVDKLYPMATKAAEVLGVSPDVLIAQAALETGWGRKVNGKQNGESTFNFFNIKADQRWQGDSVSVSTLEVRGGVPVRERADFRVYASPQDGFNDYVDFVGNSARYENALRSTDAESYIRNLAEAGYATDTEYADKIIRILKSPDLKNAVKGAMDGSAGKDAKQSMNTVVENHAATLVVSEG